MTTSFIVVVAEVTFEISWSVAFKWYIIHKVGGLYLLIWEKLPFTLGSKGLKFQII